MAEYLSFEEEDLYDCSGESLPCEFCYELFPENILILHQTKCFLEYQDPKNDMNTEPEVINKHVTASENDDSSLTKQESEKLIISAQSNPNDRISKIVEENLQQSESSPGKQKFSAEDIKNKQPEENPKFQLKNLDWDEQISPVEILNECSKIAEPDSDGSKTDFSKYNLSDDNDEDGEKETVEKLWLQASIVLKKRLVRSKKVNESQKTRRNSDSPVQKPSNRFENHHQKQKQYYH